MTTYRRDIDGLRAVAVLAVLMFHAGAPGFSGGFVGVDVFFVISGFLITGILISDMDRGPGWLARFYDRRIRRILPALLTVLTVTTVAAAIVLLPRDLRSYGGSLASTAAFLSNAFFFSQSGYFEAEAATKPLLHLWSLAVEEQYYLVWPPLLLMIQRWAPRRVGLGIVLVLAAASFGLSIWRTGAAPSEAFYLPHARAWELLLGALIAMRPVTLPRPAANLLSVLGLGLIGYAVAAFNDHLPFPGAWAAIPCVGTGLVLAAGRGWGARALSIPPLVGVGLISYSLYLWHWPILAFAQYLSLKPVPWTVNLLLCAAAGAPAYLSWRFIERPARKRPASRRMVFAWAAAALVSCAAVGAALVVTRGVPQRFPPPVLAAEQAAYDDAPGPSRCGPWRVEKGCGLGIPGTPSVVLWGDSHADAFGPAVDFAASAAGLSGRRMTRLGCPPLIDVVMIDASTDNQRACEAFNTGVLRYLADHREVRTLVVVGRWALFAEGTRYGDDPGSPPALRDEANRKAGQAAAFEAGLVRAVTAARSVRAGDLTIILVQQTPEVGFDVPRCLGLARRFAPSDAHCASVDRTAVLARLAKSRSIIERVAAAAGARVFDPLPSLCDGLRCQTVQGDMILYRDDDHLSRTGARRVGHRLTVTGFNNPARAGNRPQP